MPPDLPCADYGPTAGRRPAELREQLRPSSNRDAARLAVLRQLFLRAIAPSAAIGTDALIDAAGEAATAGSRQLAARRG